MGTIGWCGSIWKEHWSGSRGPATSPPAATDQLCDFRRIISPLLSAKLWAVFSRFCIYLLAF